MKFDKIQQMDQQLALGPFEILRCDNCGGLNIGADEETFLCAWCHFEPISSSSSWVTVPA